MDAKRQQPVRRDNRISLPSVATDVASSQRFRATRYPEHRHELSASVPEFVGTLPPLPLGIVTLTATASELPPLPSISRLPARSPADEAIAALKRALATYEISDLGDLLNGAPDARSRHIIMSMYKAVKLESLRSAGR